MKVSTILLIMIVAIILSVFFLSITSNDDPKKGYDFKQKIGNAPCAAEVPECGYCVGEKIDGYCYWNENDF